MLLKSNSKKVIKDTDDQPNVLKLTNNNNSSEQFKGFDEQKKKIKFAENQLLAIKKKKKNYIKEKNLKKKNENVNLYMKEYSFFYRGFKNKYVYWEIVIFVRKFLLSFFSVLNETIPREFAQSSLIVILFFFLLLNFKHNPYKSVKINMLENFSLFICITTVASSFWFGLVMGQMSKVFLIAVCFGMNLIFLFICGIMILKEVAIRYKSKSRKLLLGFQVLIKNFGSKKSSVK